MGCLAGQWPGDQRHQTSVNVSVHVDLVNLLQRYRFPALWAFSLSLDAIHEALVAEDMPGRVHEAGSSRRDPMQRYLGFMRSHTAKLRINGLTRMAATP